VTGPDLVQPLADADGIERLRFGLDALLAGFEALGDAERAR
jgi:hypothetical protein